jgi:transcriptional regulator GlxA family with amidase domain
MHADGSILASVCSGSLLLAEAGLLDGIKCAGHWAYRDLFRDAGRKVKGFSRCVEMALSFPCPCH